ncbi:MAG: Ig-like domain repeat protein [Pirellulales bacterium]
MSLSFMLTRLMRHAIAVIPLVLFAVTAAARAAPIDDLPAPIITRQAVFSIPFTVPAVDVTQQPAEVRLLASADRGGTWQVTDRVDLRVQRLPYKGRFTFRAPSDGEYWFALRTVDRTGQMRSDRGGLPELRVLVDTRPPRLEFSAMRGAAGEIVVRWQSVDPNLKPDSLKLQYQSTADQRWRPIAIDPPSRGAMQSTMSHTATWWPADAAGLLTIKAEVSDAAGNTTVAQAQVDLQQNSGVPARPAWDERSPLTASMNRSVIAGNNGASSVQSRDPTSGSTDSAAASTNSRSQFDSRVPTDVDAGFSRGIPWSPDARTELPLGRGSAEDIRSIRGANPDRDENINDIGPIEGPALVPPIDGPTHPPIGNQYNPPTNMAQSPRAERPASGAGAPVYFNGGSGGNPAGDALPRQTTPRNFEFVLPPGEHLRMVNSTAFELDYEVDSVGRSGISKVELWLTRDGGRTWNNVGVDTDNRSPFRATVEGEGVYGYRLTVQSGSGLGGQPPQPGDLPEVWIGVDLTRPIARLISAEASTGDRAGEIVIRYEASDALLANRPITLLQSGRPGGPWTTIAAGLSNTGQYSWRFDETAPERVYLRLEVRDEAGNVAGFEASEPVLLQRVLPQGRLRDVRPVGESALGGAAATRQQ